MTEGVGSHDAGGPNCVPSAGPRIVTGSLI